MAGAESVAALFGFLLVCVSTAPTLRKQDVDIYSFHINSTVTSRYAITVITSRVANRLNESKEIHFEVKIPKNAFISKFRMTIEEKTYDGVVKKKEEAQQQYSDAVSRGESAGMISSVGRTLEEFKTSVTVAALSKVTFELTYEELLQRRHGKYDLLINAQPMQPVADFKIDVYIHESPGISFLEVKGGLNTKDLTNAVTTTRSVKEAWVNFYPTRDQQTSCDVCGENGMSGDLIITYDVERPKPSGELRTSNGYFVHYFAPTDIQRIPKNVVFVVDRSGSMHGRKIQQTRQALLKILGDLSAEDHFGLISFDSQVDVWKDGLVQASESNLETAKEFVRNIVDRGATDINDAVMKGVRMINRHPQEGSTSILILLTDGDPTSGETNLKRIQANVKEAIGGKFPLYCLGFGFDVNFDFLEKMALENSGLARRIYADSDADLQLQGFYEEVAVPLLRNVQLNYTGAANLTQTSFSHYYNGSEIVVAGQITDNSLDTFQTEVIAISKSDKVAFQDSVSIKDFIGILPQHEDFIQRLWAYLTVKQLLEKELTLKAEEKEKNKKEALDLSLKYKFVTPLTSMVVTKPQESETQVAHKPKEGKQPDIYTESLRDMSMLRPANRPRKLRLHGRVGGSRTALKLSRLPEQTPELFTVRRPAHPDPSGAFLSTQSLMDPLDLAVTDGLSVLNVKLLQVISAPTLPPPPPPTPAESSVRFLISSSDQTSPLCYDLNVPEKLNLLKDPASGFSMQGQDTPKVFQKIDFIFKNENVKLVLSPTEITFTKEQRSETFTWGQEFIRVEADSITLILRKKELDVSVGSLRVVFLRHEENGEAFLWPAVRQQPKDVSLQGILGKNTVQYEDLPESRIKIKNQEVKATWSYATDYRFPAAPYVGCWLVPYQFALQGELSDLAGV
ncbi:inter-alpha-trypsin inhibitor heavy chain H3 isoform X2 [Astyanax mexicanus]|uniref:inter-alpha-trypsin inhibitor heavy chain H3 isoform X1 n=1 Tax=Astyanax mexicanus TaxID=7994 RepID=UPI0020CB32D0|nr:inter-alpha-trypsin inhibitor heavy chain H3 isoform X1 [Astyanax mexicanus]XP_049327494.1 inter-alpha-trypsin inhibitor heavy chain H3 isoform X2 [Astyanax mexicanus]